MEVLMASGAEVLTVSAGTRAGSLNEGAAKATRAFLWFLHADSQLPKDWQDHLLRAQSDFPEALSYFDLAYSEGGLARLNAVGANVRSRAFGLPYGDQGFFCARDTFKRAGPYPEHAPYGEDLLFLRRAKALGVPLHRIPAKLGTSARKYHSDGWLRLTLYRWMQLLKLMRMPLDAD